MFKVTSLNSMSVLIKIFTGLASSKILALMVGPAGLALTGNLRNFLTSLEGIATLGIQNGVVKQIAANKENPDQLKKIIASVFILLLSVSVFLGFGLIVLGQSLNDAVFGSQEHFQNLFLVLGLSLPFYICGMVLTYFINGLGQYQRVIWINIWGNVLALGFTFWAVNEFKTFGALLSLIIPPAILFWISWFQLNRIIDFKNYLRQHYFDFKVIKNLSSYALMTLVSAVVGSWTLLMIRQNLIHNSGMEQAGFWEAMSRISGFYLLFISTVLTVYFYPKLSAATSDIATRNIFMSYYKGILPVFAVGLFFIFLLRNQLIAICFTDDFASVSDLFFWQLLGDFFKAASLILGYQLLAKQRTLAYIMSEVFSLILLASVAYILSPMFGAKGVVMAYAVDYFVYFLVLVVYFRKALFSK